MVGGLYLFLMSHPTMFTWPSRGLLLLLFILSSVRMTSQSCADPGLQSVLRVFSEYSDVTATCELATVPTGEVEYVDLSFEDFPGIYSFVTAQPAFLRWKVFLSPEMVNIPDLMRAVGQTPSSFWVIDVDDDGDVEFGRFLEPLGDTHLENEFLTGVREVLELIVNHPRSSDDAYFDSTAGPTEEEDMYEKSVQGCMSGVLSEWEGGDIPEGMDVRGYCECLADKIMGDPDCVSDLFNTTSEGLSELIEGCMDVLMPGLSTYVSEEMDVSEMQEGFKRGFMRGCLREAVAVLEDLGYDQPQVAEEYCECMYVHMREHPSFKMSDFDDENSVIMTEIEAACSHILTGETSGPAPVYWNQKRGCSGVRNTPILLNSGGEVRVKVSFGGVEKYLTLDSGCTEVIINEDLAKTLKIAGEIGPGDYRGLEMFILADGREVAVEKYRVREMKVGSCVMSDFVVGVIEDGGMLLGMGYLGLFDSWELDKSTQTLRTRN